MAIRIPEVVLNNGRNMPLIGLGTGGESCDATKAAVLEAIKTGYRHFDTAFIYGNEKGVGEAVVEALRLGLVKSRDELFITSKLWCTCAHRDLVLPAIKKSLESGIFLEKAEVLAGVVYLADRDEDFYWWLLDGF